MHRLNSEYTGTVIGDIKDNKGGRGRTCSFGSVEFSLILALKYVFARV